MFLQLLAPFWSKSVSFEDAVPLSTAPVGVQHPLSRAVTSLRNTLVKFWLDMCCYVPVCSGKVWHCGFLRKKRISVEKETYFLLKNGVMKKTTGHSKRWGWKCCVWQGLCPAPGHGLCWASAHPAHRWLHCLSVGCFSLSANFRMFDKRKERAYWYHFHCAEEEIKQGRVTFVGKKWQSAM